MQASLRLRDLESGIFVGKDADVAEFAHRREVVTVLGPQGSGKSTRVFVPSVAFHYGPVVFTSVRSAGIHPDVKEVTFGARSELAVGLGGSVDDLYLDDRAARTEASVCWPLLDGINEWNDALDRAAQLVGAGIPDDMHNAVTFRNHCIPILAIVLYCNSLIPGATDGMVAGDVASLTIDRLVELRDHFLKSENTPGGLLTELSAVINGHPEELPALRGVLMNSVLPGHTREFVGADRSFRAKDFVRSFGTLYVTASRAVAERRRATIGALIECIVDEWLLAFEQKMTPPGATLLLAIDEAPYICPARGLPAIFATGGGSGIQSLLGFQFPSQATKVWGSDGELFTNSANRLVLLPGLQDEKFLTWFSQLGGSELRHEPATKPVSRVLDHGLPIPQDVLLRHAEEVRALRESPNRQVARWQERLLRRRHDIELAQLGISRAARQTYRPEDLTVRDMVTERLPRFTVSELRGEGLKSNEAWVIKGGEPRKRIFDVWAHDSTWSRLLS